MESLDQHQRMASEHEAWMVLCREFDKMPTGQMVLTINDPEVTPFVRAMQAWAEFLVDLRVGQSEVQREMARTEALGKFLAIRG